MKALPVLLKPLIKRPDRDYFIGIDVTHEKGVETFAFCVMEKDDDGNCLIQHSDVLTSQYKTEQDKMCFQYVETLRRYYDCPILMEAYGNEWRDWDPINNEEAQKARNEYNNVIVKMNRILGIKDYHELQPDYTWELKQIDEG